MNKVAWLKAKIQQKYRKKQQHELLVASTVMIVTNVDAAGKVTYPT